MEAKLLTIAEASAILGVSYNTIRGLIRCGRLRGYRLGPKGGCFRIDPDDLAAYRESCAIEPAAAPRMTKKTPSTGNRFARLNGERLLGAWRDAGYVADQSG
jgi:excisionase family DNA binding protein